MKVYWAKGFAATSTDDLIHAMGIGRQSLYNAFGDKRQLYLEALDVYTRRTMAGHLERLNRPDSPLKGINDLLGGLIAKDDKLRAMGCMGVSSVGEFGTSDRKLAAIRNKAGPILSARLVERLREGQAKGEIGADIDPNEAAAFIELTMAGLQLAARGGAKVNDLRQMSRFIIDRLKAR